MNASRPAAASNAAHARQAPEGVRRHLGALLNTYRAEAALPAISADGLELRFAGHLQVQHAAGVRVLRDDCFV